jgi:hypothetical protein
MSSYQDRVQAEWEAVDKKHAALEDFINHNMAKVTCVYERRLLREQEVIMRMYKLTLSKRIAIFRAREIENER